MDNKFTPLTDEKMIEKISSFGLFDGKNEATFYAHFVPDALDPEYMFQDEKLMLYFELFTERIIDFFGRPEHFLFKYNAIVECYYKRGSLCYSAVFGNSGPTIITDKLTYELGIGELLSSKDHYLHDIKLTLRPKTGRDDKANEKCSVELHVPISSEKRKQLGIPDIVEAVVKKAEYIDGCDYIYNMLKGGSCEDKSGHLTAAQLNTIEEGNE